MSGPATALCLVTLYDELWSGVAVVAAPDVERYHGVDHAGYALWIFAAPLLLSSLIEAPIALLSDHQPKRRLLALGSATLAAALALCALATGPWMLACGLALAGAASGVTCAVAQGELVHTYAGGPQRAMSRWVAFAAVGDAIVPLLVAATIGLGGTHRAAFGAVAALIGLQAWHAYRSTTGHARSAEDRATSAQPTSDAPERFAEDAPPMPPMAALRTAARNPRLWLFLTATSLCALLDEIVIAFAALRLHADRGWTESAVATVMAAEATGAVLGALLIERLLARYSARSLMIGSALASLCWLGLFIASDSPTMAVLTLFLLGLCAAPHYPLCMAAAYEVAPGRPGIVNALIQLFVVVDILAPLAIGSIAKTHSLTFALALLAVQPVAVTIAGLADCSTRKHGTGQNA